MSPSPEPMSRRSKNNESKIENAWAFMQPDSWSEDRLENSVLQNTAIKIYSFYFKAQQRS